MFKYIRYHIVKETESICLIVPRRSCIMRSWTFLTFSRAVVIVGNVLSCSFLYDIYMLPPFHYVTYDAIMCPQNLDEFARHDHSDTDMWISNLDSSFSCTFLAWDYTWLQWDVKVYSFDLLLFYIIIDELWSKTNEVTIINKCIGGFINQIKENLQYHKMLRSIKIVIEHLARFFRT